MTAGAFDGLTIAQAQAIANRRRRAQRLGLRLDAPLEVIEAAERQCRNKLHPIGCECQHAHVSGNSGNGVEKNAPSPAGTQDRLYFPANCRCGHGLSWHADRGYAACTFEGCACAGPYRTTESGSDYSREYSGPETPGSDPDLIIEAEPLPLEKPVQLEVKKLYEAAGCKVYNLSQARASKQTPGIADLWVKHRKRGIAFWHETKRPGGDLTAAQLEFRDGCRDCGIRHVSGGVEEAKKAIAKWGLRP